MEVICRCMLCVSLALLTVLVGCGGGGGSGGSGGGGAVVWPQYTDAPPAEALTISDPVNDLLLAPGGAPPSIIPYPPVDLASVRIWSTGGYLYIRTDFNGVIPTAPQVVSGQTVTQQGFNISMDTDNNPATGASVQGIGGVDIYFAFLIPYGSGGPAPYANYGFTTSDIHSNTGHVEGELREGGPGYNYATYRFSRATLGSLLPSGRTAAVGGWAEAESSQYHHFAYDALTTATWVIP